MKISGSIISSCGGTRYTGPIARPPKGVDDPARRAAGSGSRPTRGLTSTPSSASKDESGHLGRRVPGALKSGR
jgi:hypothetical protein